VRDAAFFLASVKWRERSSSPTGRSRRGELAVCRSRKRDALVAQNDFFTEGNEGNKVGKVSSTEDSKENEDCDLRLRHSFAIRHSGFVILLIRVVGESS
jgi:hypothetical protein